MRIHIAQKFDRINTEIDTLKTKIKVLEEKNSRLEIENQSIKTHLGALQSTMKKRTSEDSKDPVRSTPSPLTQLSSNNEKHPLIDPLHEDNLCKDQPKNIPTWVTNRVDIKSDNVSIASPVLSVEQPVYIIPVHNHFDQLSESARHLEPKNVAAKPMQQPQ